MSVYIATSLDGFIATGDGSVEWLEKVEGDGPNGYERYYSGVDAVVMGRKTYETILGFDVPFPYQDKDCYVFSNQLTNKDENATFINGTIENLIATLSGQQYEKIWVSGGGLLVSELVNQGYVTELIVTVAPVILGSGIPLFSEINESHSLKLEKATRYGQFVEMHYTFAT